MTNEIRNPNAVDPVTPIDRLYSDWSDPVTTQPEDLEMNHAQRKSLTSKVGTTVTALNPKTEKWEQGTVTGTYHRERIGDFDIGLVIDFGQGNVEVNQKQVDE